MPQFLIKTWNFIKRQWKKALAIVGIGVALAAGEIITQPQIPLTLTIDEKPVSVAYTDNNTGECLIIHTNQSDYPNIFGNFNVLYSVTNKCGQDQNVKTTFGFSGDENRRHIVGISEYDGEAPQMRDMPVITSVKTATGTEDVVSYQKKEVQVTKWKNTALEGFGRPTAIKDIGQTKEIKANSVLIKKDETKFFRANIKYADLSGKEQFFVEAFGDKAGYGNLDPWTYSELFNTLTDGDLSGQGIWSGSTAVDVTTVDKYEGAKSIVFPAMDNAIVGTLGASASTGGTFYFAIKDNRTTVNREFQTFWRDATDANSIPFDFVVEAGGTRFNYYLAGWNALDLLSRGQWYVFEIEYSGAGNTWKYRFHDGSSWTAQSGAYSCRGTCAEIDTINIYMYNTGDSYQVYFDTITPTNPVVAPTTPSVYVPEIF